MFTMKNAIWTVERLVVFVSSLNLAMTACAIAATGCALVIYGCVREAASQLDLLQSSGRAALDAYLALVSSHQLDLAAFMVQSVAGNCYAFGAFAQGTGLWVAFVLTPVTTALVLLARVVVAGYRSVATAAGERRSVSV
jgi:hypothetical protein